MEHAVFKKQDREEESDQKGDTFDWFYVDSDATKVYKRLYPFPLAFKQLKGVFFYYVWLILSTCVAFVWWEVSRVCTCEPTS